MDKQECGCRRACGCVWVLIDVEATTPQHNKEIRHLELSLYIFQVYSYNLHFMCYHFINKQTL